MSINMKKEYQKELRSLNWQKRFHERQTAKIISAGDRQIKKLKISVASHLKANVKTAIRIDKRIAILEGRLS